MYRILTQEINFNGYLATDYQYMFDSCEFVYLNMKFFQVNTNNNIQNHNTSPAGLKYFCIEDTQTKTKLSINSDTLDCSHICFRDNIKIDSSTKECIDSCANNGYQYEYNNICRNDCPLGTYKISKNNMIICTFHIKDIPENYYLDNNDNIYKQCHQNCKTCNQFGDDTTNNCNECKNGYKFVDDSLLNEKNCYENCDNYYYINGMNEYSCINTCPSEYNKIIEPRKKCIDDCQKDNLYIYENNNNCLEECPSDKKTDIEEKKCYISCHDYKFEYNNNCLSDCPDNTFRIFINRNIYFFGGKLNIFRNPVFLTFFPLSFI